MSQAGANSSSGGGGGSSVETLTGNSGGAVSPTLNNINTVGTGSITIVGNPGTSTLTTQLTGLTNHAVLVGAGTATITKVGPTATAGQVLQSAGSSADPAFSTATYPSTTTANAVLYSTATNVVGQTTPVIDGVMISDHAAGVPSFLANGTAGFVLTAQSGAPPAWAAASAGGSPQAVFAHVSSNISNVTGDGTAYTVVFDTIDHQTGSGYNNSTGVFTAANTGYYSVTTATYFEGLGVAHTQMAGGILGPPSSAGTCNFNPFPVSTSGVYYLNNALIMFMTAAQTCSIVVLVGGGTKTVSIQTPSQLSICYLGSGV